MTSSLKVLFPLVFVIFCQCSCATIDTIPNTGPKLIILPTNEAIFKIPATKGNAGRALTCKAGPGYNPTLFSDLHWNGPNERDWRYLETKHRVNTITQTATSTIYFRNTSSDDDGIYHCSAKYSSEPVSVQQVVKTYTPIEKSNCPDRQFIVKGDVNSLIHCQVTGFGAQVRFFKDSYDLEQNTRYRQLRDIGLGINGPVDDSDEGYYTAEVTSMENGETVTINIDVSVNSAPVIKPYDREGPEFFGIEGDKAVLNCTAFGKPQPLITWLSPKLKNISQDIGGYEENRADGTLTIRRVNRHDDEGNFKCIAYNSVNQTERAVKFAVLTKPIITSFENKTADENSTVTLECRATGVPKPQFSIRRAGLNEEPFRIGDGHVTDIDLKIEEAGLSVYIYQVKLIVTRQLTGPIFCNATNNIGSTAERVGFLHVNYKPDLSKTNADVAITSERNAHLVCVVRAHPAPTITWYADGVQFVNVESNMNVSGDQYTYTVRPPSNMGISNRYTCRASNMMGNSQVDIFMRYATAPGIVDVYQRSKNPTTATLELTVKHDGFVRVKKFIYTLRGTTLDYSSPIYYPVLDRNETVIDASSNQATYTIRNLYPKYDYRFKVRAVNDIGDGPWNEFNFQTSPPRQPEPPKIIHPHVSRSDYVISDYSNGYLLKWSPPDLDNGDRVTKYIIKINKREIQGLDNPDSHMERVIEQMGEKSLSARLGPLEPNQAYKIQVVAHNQYGDSMPDYITIRTPHDGAIMSEYEPSALSWLADPPTPVLIGILVSVIALLIIMDLIFHICYQVGVTYTIRYWCCPSKATSVISE